MLYSRNVGIDKIAEVLGGKEKKNFDLFQEYLQMQDYRNVDIEESLRSFLGTFRMAGVESQVVFKILEEFGSVFYDKITARGVNFFSDKTECYEFAYLLIVLQTCQHNRAIK